MIMFKIAFMFKYLSNLSVFKVNKSKLTNVSGTVLMGARLHREAPVSVGCVGLKRSFSIKGNNRKHGLKMLLNEYLGNLFLTADELF